MKTILKFEECHDSKQTVILRHDKDVQIYKEVRKDHIQWKDIDGNIKEYATYIVIRFPKSKNVDLSSFRKSKKDRTTLGFLVNELEEEIEILYYDQVTFTWRLNELAETGLLKSSQRTIPDWEYGELFPCYINAYSVKKFSYNLIFGLIELPFVFYKSKKRMKLLELKNKL